MALLPAVATSVLSIQSILSRQSQTYFDSVSSASRMMSMITFERCDSWIEFFAADLAECSRSTAESVNNFSRSASS